MSDQRNHQSWLVPLVAWVTFFSFGHIAAPIPGVNEPHYLCKAKHFWQPDWCSQDFFLESPNAHTVFYATIGSVTNFLSFEQSACVGRALAALTLAWGWTHCLSQLFFNKWSAIWTLWFFLAFTACGNFSGEWLVGGVEGKVFAYGFLLAALGDVYRQRWRLAASWAGLAVMIHPVVGIWGLLAFAISRSLHRVNRWRRERRLAFVTGVPQPGIQSLMPGSSMAVSLQSSLILFLLALPGLVPVVRLLLEPVTPELRYQATYIQVYFRLAHHLDPMVFPVRAYCGYAVLLFIWLSSFRWGGRTSAKKEFDHIVFWAVVFALAGILIGFGPRPPIRMPYFAERMNLLKFYPFRLADVLVPVAVAVSLVGVLERTLFNPGYSARRASLISIPMAIMALIFCAGLLRAHSIAETNRYSLEDRKDWLDICRWIDNHLPADALVETPTNCWAFKWFARRAEYVAFKDCPQDAAGIVEWNRRLTFLKNWFDTQYRDQYYSASELKELRRLTGLSHLLTDRLGPLELEPIHRNGTFQVYDLRLLGD